MPGALAYHLPLGASPAISITPAGSALRCNKHSSRDATIANSAPASGAPSRSVTRNVRLGTSSAGPGTATRVSSFGCKASGVLSSVAGRVVVASERLGPTGSTTFVGDGSSALDGSCTQATHPANSTSKTTKKAIRREFMRDARRIL